LPFFKVGLFFLIVGSAAGDDEGHEENGDEDFF
jgi:hypothetical protein